MGIPKEDKPQRAPRVQKKKEKDSTRSGDWRFVDPGERLQVVKLPGRGKGFMTAGGRPASMSDLFAEPTVTVAEAARGETACLEGIPATQGAYVDIPETGTQGVVSSRADETDEVAENPGLLAEDVSAERYTVDFTYDSDKPLATDTESSARLVSQLVRWNPPMDTESMMYGGDVAESSREIVRFLSRNNFVLSSYELDLRKQRETIDENERVISVLRTRLSAEKAASSTRDETINDLKAQLLARDGTIANLEAKLAAEKEVVETLSSYLHDPSQDVSAKGAVVRLEAELERYRAFEGVVASYLHDRSRVQEAINDLSEARGGCCLLDELQDAGVVVPEEFRRRAKEEEDECRAAVGELAVVQLDFCDLLDPVLAEGEVRPSPERQISSARGQSGTSGGATV